MPEAQTFVYADGRQVMLPATWTALDGQTREIAVVQVRSALAGTPDSLAEMVQHYYSPSRNFAGALLDQLEPNPADDIVAADLLAVGMLSMKIEPAQARSLLLGGSRRRTDVLALLRAIPFGLPITSLDSQDPAVHRALGHMWDLQNTLRSLMDDQIPGSNTWVFAAKLCARKRPYLFPVRDRVVCRYLAGGASLKRGHGPGNFSIDLQLFAYLMSLEDIAKQLAELRRVLQERGYVLDPSDLRLLDVVLWVTASQLGR